MSTPWFTVKEVKPHIFGIAEFAHEEEVISYLIVGRTHALLIDSGLGARPIRPIVESITSLPIVLTHTHHHWDHIGGDHEFSNKIDAQSVMSIDCEPFHFRILTCPGHSPDSIALWDAAKGYLFIGDTLYDGPLYLMLPESSMQSFSNTLDMLSRLCGIQHIFPSHNTFSFDPADIMCVQDVVKRYLVAPNQYADVAEIPIRGRLRLKVQ